MDKLYDGLVSAFNSTYEAVGSMAQKEINAPMEIDNLMVSLKSIVNSLNAISSLCQDAQLKEVMDRNCYEKNNLLRQLEFDINQKRVDPQQSEYKPNL